MIPVYYNMAPTAPSVFLIPPLMSLQSFNLASSEKITEWWFNVSQTGLIAGNFTHVTNPANVVADSIVVAYDSLNVANGGDFDIRFSFPTANNDPNEFGNNQKSIYNHMM